jgi:hypothetical protein
MFHLYDQGRSASIHYFLSVEPSPPETNRSIATELSLATEMVGSLYTLV